MIQKVALNFKNRLYPHPFYPKLHTFSIHFLMFSLARCHDPLFHMRRIREYFRCEWNDRLGILGDQKVRAEKNRIIVLISSPPDRIHSYLSESTGLAVAALMDW